MSRINTFGIIAFVDHVLLTCDFSEMENPRNAMGELTVSVCKAKHAIPALSQASSPFPAILGFVNLGKKSLWYSGGEFHGLIVHD
jgi:hypothetical protein